MYFAVNVRRRARSGTSGSGRSVPASFIRPGSSIPVARTNAVTLFVKLGLTLAVIVLVVVGVILLTEWELVQLTSRLP